LNELKGHDDQKKMMYIIGGSVGIVLLIVLILAILCVTGVICGYEKRTPEVTITKVDGNN